MSRVRQRLTTCDFQCFSLEFFEFQRPITNDTKTKLCSLVLSSPGPCIYEGKKWTPKHIGLGSSLHQLTRSKGLVQLFHQAGHVLSYQDILKLDTSISRRYVKINGAVIPPNGRL